MTESPSTFRDDPETHRITRVVQRAADAAYQTRVADALAAGYAAVDPARLERRRSDEGITEERWAELSMSTRNARSPEEFQAFARALSVSPRWLATGSGWVHEPPAGWAAFGTHIDEPDVPLDFSSEEDECLMPLWERPRLAVSA